MKLRHLILFLLALLTLAASAQRRKRHQPKVEQKNELAERIERMTKATQRIMFIDSIVLPKTEFLNAYNLSPESGIITSYQNFFKQKRQPNAYVFKPSIGNQCYFSLESSDSTIQLYTSEISANKKWTRPVRMRGINDERLFTQVNYPFMMADGKTFYFAAKGEGSIGGYDIFVTTFDTEEGRFLKPENIGMPFNSTANDYMFVIDEYDSLGWFATDRNQEEGEVCIYTFIPSDSWRSYNEEQYTPEEIDAFARIADITATWDDRELLDMAFTRLRLNTMRKNKQETGKEFTFVINDDIDYHQQSDFKAPGNLERYRQLIALRARQEALIKALDRARDYYATAPNDEREELAAEMLESEHQQHRQFMEIHQMEKTIRNAENRYINPNKYAYD